MAQLGYAIRESFGYQRFAMFAAGMIVAAMFNAITRHEWWAASFAAFWAALDLLLVWNIDRLDREIEELERELDDLKFGMGE